MVQGSYFYPHAPYGMPVECQARMGHGHASHMHHPMSHGSQMPPFYHDHQGYPVRYHPASFSEPYNPPGFGGGMSCKHSHCGNEPGR